MLAPALLRAGLLLYLAAGTRQLSLSEFYVPDAVVAGEDAELRCQYDLASNETVEGLYVKWWWTMAEIKDNDTIILKDLQPHNSGSYQCEVFNDNEIRQKRNLTVYTQGSGPQLNISTIEDGPDEGDVADLLIECEAENVAPEPTLTIIYNGNPLSEITEVLSESKGLYRISANATLSKEDLEAGEFQCQMTFPLHNFTHPAYVDVEQYDPAGVSATTTEVPSDAAADTTPSSLQNPSDTGHQLHCSWALLTAAAALANLITLK